MCRHFLYSSSHHHRLSKVGLIIQKFPHGLNLLRIFFLYLTAVPLFKLVYYRISQYDLCIPLTPAQVVTTHKKGINFPTLPYIPAGASWHGMVVVQNVMEVLP